MKDNYYFLYYFFDVRNCICNLHVQVHDSSENEIPTETETFKSQECLI